MAVPGTERTTNESIFYDLYRISDANLKEYICGKGGIKREEFTLEKIFTILIDVIRGEQLFDHGNTQVIFCSPELERCLEVKAMHVSQLKDLLLKKMALTGKKLSKQERDADLKKKVVDKEARFKVSEALLKALRTVPGFSQQGSVFTYNDITLALSKYILMNKQRFFDTRNITLAMVQDDLLGQAFGVRGFHRSQVNGLLMKQLEPIESGPELDNVDLHCCLMDGKTDDADGTDWVLVELLSKVKLDEEKIAGKRKLED